MTVVHVTFTREQAIDFAERVFTALGESILRRAYVGSLGRGELVVHDIDLLVEPASVDSLPQIRDSFSYLGQLTKDGRKWMQLRDAFDEPYLQIDLWVCFPPAQWEVRHAQLTTPADLVQMVWRGLRERGYQHKGGRLLDQMGGEIPIPNERAWFELAGVPYVEPSERMALLERLTDDV